MDPQSKYDRQLRLWAGSGQARLEAAHVLLVGADAVGCEALKNLVLPGVGRFLVMDAAATGTADLAVNFHLAPESAGTNRAVAAVAGLQELNLDLAGGVVAGSLAEALAAAQWSQYDLVIAANLGHGELGPLRDALWAANVPLLAATSVGFYGLVRVYAREVCVVETHPILLVDLRLDAVWSELQQHVDAIDLEALLPSERAAVPFLVVLIKALQQWQAGDSARLPKSRTDKAELKAVVAAMAGPCRHEQNFEEAVAGVGRCAQPSTVPADLQALLGTCDREDSTPFWTLMRGLREFVARTGRVPLLGILPDMAASTEHYVALQRLYRAKAAADQAEMAEYVAAAGGEVPGEVLKVFCQNCRFVHVAKSTTVEAVTGTMVAAWRDAVGRTPATGLECEDEVAYMGVYLSLLAHGEGAVSEAEVGAWVRSTLGVAALPEAVQAPVQETVRAAGTELHNTLSLVGGVVGQEALKLLTGQYRPVDNVVVWDGIRAGLYKWRVE